jgi:hypothetical protein
MVCWAKTGRDRYRSRVAILRELACRGPGASSVKTRQAGSYASACGELSLVFEKFKNCCLLNSIPSRATMNECEPGGVIERTAEQLVGIIKRLKRISIRIVYRYEC